MKLLTSSALIFLLLANSFNTVTSLPEMIAADYANLFNNPYVKEARRQSYAAAVFRDSDREPEVHNFVPNEVESEYSEQEDIEPRSVIDLASSANVQDVLASIHRSIMAMERSRASRMNVRHTNSEDSGKRDPVNSFVRIGRGGTAFENPDDDNPDFDDVEANLFHVTDGRNDFVVDTEALSRDDISTSKDLTNPFVDSEDGVTNYEDTDIDSIDANKHNTYSGDDDKSSSESFGRYRRGYSLLRYGRSSTPHSSLSRTGKSGPGSLLQLLARPFVHPTGSWPRRNRLEPRSSFYRFGRYYPRNNFQIGRERERRMQDAVLPVVRRSYVKIGKLPASVFMQRVIEDGVTPDLSESTLAGRRSEGYMLTPSAVLRAGK